MAVYLATALPMPDKGRAPLTLEPAAPETAERLKKHLVLPHLYFVASHEGCGCGFILDHEGGTDEDCAARHASVDALRELVVEVAKRGNAEVLVCFDGEEAIEPDHSRTLEYPDDLEVKWGDRVLWCIPGRP